jgi:hypothetical protein
MLSASSMDGDSVTPQHDNTQPVKLGFGGSVAELEMRSEESKDYAI